MFGVSSCWFLLSLTHCQNRMIGYDWQMTRKSENSSYHAIWTIWPYKQVCVASLPKIQKSDNPIRTWLSPWFGIFDFRYTFRNVLDVSLSTIKTPNKKLSSAGQTTLTNELQFIREHIPILHKSKKIIWFVCRNNVHFL